MEDTPFHGCLVIFHNVLEWYKPREKINCQFSLEGLIEEKEHPDCFVAIFTVGWDSLTANLIRKNFSLVESISDRLFQVDFLEEELPEGNPDEFYQFCFYNIKSEIIYGASCPFQVCTRENSEPFIVCGGEEITIPDRKSPNKIQVSATANLNESWTVEGSKIQMNDDEDFDTVMVVKKTIDEDSLSKVELNNEILLKTNRDVKLESEKTTNEINRLTHDLEVKERRAVILEERFKENEKVIKHLNNQMREMKEDIISEYENKLKELILEREQLKTDRAKAYLENNLLKGELQEKEQKFINEIAQLKNVIDLEKNSCKLLEDEHKNVLEKFGEIKDAHGKGVQETKQVEVKLVEVTSHLKIEKQKNESLINDLENLNEAVNILKIDAETNAAGMKNKESSFKEQLANAASEIQDLQKENLELSESLGKANKKEKDLHETNQCAVDRINELEPQLEQICQLKAQEVQRLAAQIEKQSELIGEHDAIVESLESQITEKNKEIIKMKYTYERENEQTQTVVEELRSKVEELQQQIEENKPQEMKPMTMTKAEGSYYALQVAYTFVQKQLKRYKVENEELRKVIQQSADQGTMTPGVESLVKENTDIKQRLSYGKHAYENKTAECEKLRNELKYLKKKTAPDSSDKAKNSEVK
jgi:Chromosome segregation ATPases